MKFEDWKKLLIEEKENDRYIYVYKDSVRNLSRTDLFCFGLPKSLEDIETIEDFINNVSFNDPENKFEVYKTDNLTFCLALTDEVTHLLVYTDDNILYFDTKYFCHGLQGSSESLDPDFIIIEWTLDNEKSELDFLRVSYKNDVYQGNYSFMKKI